MPELLLEIGCEEMPGPWLPDLAEQLGRRFADAARRERLEPRETETLWTPRRLVLRSQVHARQEDREVQVWGPALKVARDAAGGWTKAALGFARKNGVAPEELSQAPKNPKKPDEIHLVHVKSLAGRNAGEVLGEVVGSVLRGLSFPKRMSWDAWLDDGKGSWPFGRPVRWLVILLAGEVVPFAIHAMEGGEKGAVIVRSGDTTRGHRYLPRGAAGREIPVTSFESLREQLRRNFVLLDPAERAERIAAGLAGHGCEGHPLATEWRDLVEHPAVVLGTIPKELRDLPEEVLSTVLVHHQKYIPVGGPAGVTGFAAVTNTDGSAASEIVRGMERVVVARLRDAAFFYAEDQKRSLADRVKDLEGVTFHRALGTYREKAARLQRLVEALFDQTGLAGTPEREAAREAALLAKADLTTLMVRELPELQGIMGGIYLRAEGHALPEVAAAVRWHYHPVSLQPGDAPAGVLGGRQARVFAAVSLADKLDTLVGYFGIGEEPTGSRDPYGLRRAAQGAIRVVLDFWDSGGEARPPNLGSLLAVAVTGHGEAVKVESPALERTLETFLLDRLEFVLTSRGFPLDEVRAVIQTPGADALADPQDCLVRLTALSRVRSEAREDFEHLAVAFKRASNILREQPQSDVEPKLFTEAAERELHEAVERLRVSDGGYEARLRALASLRGPVDRFFDDVLVMAEEPKVRSNRLGLLAQTLSLFYRISDISKLGGKA